MLKGMVVLLLTCLTSCVTMGTVVRIQSWGEDVDITITAEEVAVEKTFWETRVSFHHPNSVEQWADGVPGKCLAAKEVYVDRDKNYHLYKLPPGYDAKIVTK